MIMTPCAIARVKFTYAHGFLLNRQLISSTFDNVRGCPTFQGTGRCMMSAPSLKSPHTCANVTPGSGTSFGYGSATKSQSRELSL